MARSPVKDPRDDALPYTPESFQRGRLQGASHPGLVDFLRDLPHIDTLPETLETVVYMARPNLVREVLLPASLGVPWSRLVVKRFGWRGQQHYLFSPLKRSRAMKAYQTACYLLSHQLDTPMPLGVFEERHRGFVQYNVLATEAIANYVTLRQYRETLPDGPQGMDEVLPMAADYTRRLHDCGIWHRDMVLSNFLLADSPDGRRLYLIDLNRAYRLSVVPMWVRALDIARMDWKTWHMRFVELYCADRYPVGLMQTLVQVYRRWRMLRQWTKPLRRRLQRVLRIA